MTSIVWFRRDLRTIHHEALSAAAVEGPVVPVFVVDPEVWPRAGRRRRPFFAEALADLRRATDGALVVRHGRPVEVLARLADEVGADAVWATDDHGPYGRARDDEVGETLAARGLAVHYRGGNWGVVPDVVKSGQGGPYQVFTPYFRQWSKLVERRTPPADVDVRWQTVADAGEIPEAVADIELPDATPAAALDRLDEFLDGPIETYADDRDRPAVDGTSGLSPHLHAGLIHPHQILDAVDERFPADHTGAAAFRRELAFRDFYAEVLFQQPSSAWESMKGAAVSVAVDRGPEADRRFEAWAAGRTGYPIVDAGMRQLAATGWMHNRVRMLTASFLTKHLHLPWQRGARHFLDQLVDGDLSSNQHGWQWVAGTGTDASPYHRIFNPTRQGERFDPDGDYVRRWVPELAELGRAHVHEPWTRPAGIPAGYPAPIVDLAEERAEALRRLERARAAT